MLVTAYAGTRDHIALFARFLSEVRTFLSRCKQSCLRTNIFVRRHIDATKSSTYSTVTDFARLRG